MNIFIYCSIVHAVSIWRDSDHSTVWHTDTFLYKRKRCSYMREWRRRRRIFYSSSTFSSTPVPWVKYQHHYLLPRSTVMSHAANRT